MGLIAFSLLFIKVMDMICIELCVLFTDNTIINDRIMDRFIRKLK